MASETSHRPTLLVARLVVATLAALPLVSCASPTCEDLYESLSESVDGVETAEFECVNSPTHNSRTGELHAGDVTEAEAEAIMEDVLKTYAREPRLDNADVPYVGITSADETVTIGASHLGFNGTPSIGMIREHYNIKPDGS